jgi:hypothetical protein
MQTLGKSKACKELNILGSASFIVQPFNSSFINPKLMLAGRGKGSGPQVQRIADPLLREVNCVIARSLEAVFQVFSTIYSLVSSFLFSEGCL